eukprot:2010898-Prymnesium_polylepis.1
MVSCRASARLHCPLTRKQTWAAMAAVLPVAEASQPSAQEHASTTLAPQHDGTARTVAMSWVRVFYGPFEVGGWNEG